MPVHWCQACSHDLCSRGQLSCPCPSQTAYGDRQLLYADVHWYICVHHVATFALFFVGYLAADKTHTSMFLRLATYWLLQATTEQPTYLAMSMHHYANYLEVQGICAQRQMWLRKWVSGLMGFTKWYSIPQKVSRLKPGSHFR